MSHSPSISDSPSSREPVWEEKQDDTRENMASTITLSDFKDALSRYPEVLKSITKTPKPGSIPLAELDEFRYVEAPARFSLKTGKSMEMEDLIKLIEWKLRHGIFRPTLPKLVAANSTQQLQEATDDAFSHYASSPDDIKTVLQKLANPLRGIGPATASLLLAVHDPDHVIFFSDEVYQWLCADGEKVTIKYTSKEFDTLFVKAKILMGRLAVNPIDIEKVAFVLIKESAPVIEPAAKKEPSGRPRGRPRKPELEITAVDPSIPRRGRGRPRKDGKPTIEAPKAIATGKRGRPKKAIAEEEDLGEDELVETIEETPRATPVGKRGRPKKVNIEEEKHDDGQEVEGSAETPEATPARKRGRPKKVIEEKSQDEDEGAPAPVGAVKRGRGRPKTIISDAQKQNDPVGLPKRGRGRPAKARPSEQNQDEDNEEATPTTPAGASKRKAEDNDVSDHGDKKARLSRSVTVETVGS
ncbi:uncharacterized protein BP5553_08527 [Venustampulla echinocandica]|uniref:Uncharacterized protein n=1 Tax=Venustampulla echinocandica TaxID=2656787 RepID=A0A370TEG8_9HELO|nr:uncharacterized protein BP5553_08527 [Venustampulla echinocandica]RDL33088.1 hypothetical protein BP5553_08527 [Venustampulla echinocandica]